LLFLNTQVKNALIGQGALDAFDVGAPDDFKPIKRPRRIGRSTMTVGFSV
jgi:hypothetical protein